MSFFKKNICENSSVCFWLSELFPSLVAWIHFTVGIIKQLHLLQMSHMSFSDWSLGGALASTCNTEVQFQASVSRPDVSWPNEKEEMRKGHKCVWCMQSLMESAFASTLAGEWRPADAHLHHASQEKGNGDGREIPKLVHFNCRVMNLFSLKLLWNFFPPNTVFIALS